jgi:hypothetical protein
MNRTSLKISFGLALKPRTSLTSKVIIVTSQQFIKKLISQAQVLKLKIVFRSCEDKDKDFKANKEYNNLDQVPKRLHIRYKNFFNTDKIKQQPLY